MSAKNRSPILAVGALGLFGALFAAAIPQVQSSGFFLSLNPPEQYLLWNLGIGLIFTAVFGVIVSVAVKKPASLGNILVHGIASFAVFSFVIDMLEPPFALNAAGQFIVPVGATLEGTSVDYMTAWVYSTQLGVSGPALFWATYLVTPIAALALFAIVLGPKRLLGIYTGGSP